MARTTATTESKVRAAQNAGKVHDWPNDAGDCTELTWSIYVKNQCFRAFDDWNSSDLFELARCSRLQSIAIEEMDKLESEGLISYGGKSGLVPVENPRNRALSTISGNINSILRRLGVTTSTSGKSPRDNRAKQERDAAGKGGMDERPYNGQSLM